MNFLIIVSAPGPGWSRFDQCQSKGHVRPCSGQGQVQGQELDNFDLNFTLFLKFSSKNHILPVVSSFIFSKQDQRSIDVIKAIVYFNNLDI